MTRKTPAVAVLVLVAALATACQTKDSSTSSNSSSGSSASDAPSTTASTTETTAAKKGGGPAYAGKKDTDRVAPAPGAPIRLSGWTTTAGPLTRISDGLGGHNLCSTVTLKNRDTEQQDYSPLSWKLQVPTGNVQDVTYGGDDDLASNSLAPGGTVTAKVCFEDKAAGKGQYILSWQPDVFSHDDRGVWLNTL